MRAGILGVLLALAVSAIPADAQDARRPMTVDDAMDMVQIGSPLMSPDGSWVLYSRRTLNWDDNEYETGVLAGARRRRRSVPLHR